MAQDTEPIKTLPFFRLPRELRDDIYDGLLENITMVGGEIHEGLVPLHHRHKRLWWTLKTAKKNLLLVCHQFEKEYWSRVKYNSILLIESYALSADLKNVLVQISNPLLAHVAELNITLNFHPGIYYVRETYKQDCNSRARGFNCRHVMNELRSDLSSMPSTINHTDGPLWNFRFLNITIYLSKHCFKHFVTQRERLAWILANCEKLICSHKDMTMSVELFVGNGDSNPGEPVARWTREKAMEVLDAGEEVLAKLKK